MAHRVDLAGGLELDLVGRVVLGRLRLEPLADRAEVGRVVDDVVVAGHLATVGRGKAEGRICCLSMNLQKKDFKNWSKSKKLCQGLNRTFVPKICF